VGNGLQDRDTLSVKGDHDRGVLQLEINAEALELVDKGRHRGQIDRQAATEQSGRPEHCEEDGSTHRLVGTPRRVTSAVESAVEAIIIGEKISGIDEASDTLKWQERNKVVSKELVGRELRPENKANGDELRAPAAVQIHGAGRSRVPESSREVSRLQQPVVQLEAVDEGYQMHLNVDGGELGPLHLKVDVDEKAVKATVIVENAEAARTVQSCEPAIREALAQQSLQVSSFDVRDGAMGTNSNLAWGQGPPGSPGGGPAVQISAESLKQMILQPEPAGTWELSWEHSGLVDLVA